VFDDLRICGLTYQSRVVWPAHHGLTPKRRLAERYETALVFSKGDAPAFNPSAARRPQLNPGKSALYGPNITEHVAQYPEALAMRAILLYTQPGDLV
jgi:DNA modification methylase